MLDYLNTIPGLYLFLALSGAFVLVSIFCVVIVKLFIPLHLRYQDNAVIGTTVCLLSVIYSVLSGFSALYLLNNNNYASDAIQREANAAADIYRDNQWMKEPLRASINNHLRHYLTNVITIEWPLMRSAKKVSDDSKSIINEITSELIHYQATTDQETQLVQDMLDGMRVLYDARQQRIHVSYSQLSDELWIVILVATILMLGMNYLYGMNFYLHLIIVSSAALMVSSMLFLLITLDRPFQGEFAITPDPFKMLLTLMDNPKLEQK